MRKLVADTAQMLRGKLLIDANSCLCLIVSLFSLVCHVSYVKKRDRRIGEGFSWLERRLHEIQSW